MFKSKSALFISVLFAAQLASAGSVIIEKQATPPFDESLNGAVILECQPDNGSVILEKGIIVQDKLAGGLVIEKAPAVHYAGGVILERGIIVQKHLAGSVMLENSPQLNRGGTVIIEKQLSA